MSLACSGATHRRLDRISPISLTPIPFASLPSFHRSTHSSLSRISQSRLSLSRFTRLHCATRSSIDGVSSLPVFLKFSALMFVKDSLPKTVVPPHHHPLIPFPRQTHHQPPRKRLYGVLPCPHCFAPHPHQNGPRIERTALYDRSLLPG